MAGRDEIWIYLQLRSYKPLTAEEMAVEFGEEYTASFAVILAALEEEGLVIRNRKGRYGIPRRMNLCVGRLQGNARGYAFLIPDDPQEQDVYIKSEDMGGAMHNDRVVARLYRHLEDGRRREGEIIRVLKRANEKIVGTYESSRYFGFVVPDDKRLGQGILIPKTETAGAGEGDKVVVEIVQWPEARRNAEGKIIEVLGHSADPGIDILSIVRKYQLPEGFPPEVLRAAARIPATIDEQETGGRRDLRPLPMVTIDGEDAKDLDDAVSLEMLDDGHYRLGVHIADVGYYVREDSVLDREAFRRGTSVYLPDRVIPMLPQRLSNGICSLNPREDRLAMTCLMEIDPQGETVRSEIFPSVIRVDERMTYTDVRQILEEQTPELIKRYAAFTEIFQRMRDLCLLLRQKRLARGAIDFDLPESKVKLDERGKPLEIFQRERTIAEMIIEEFMIAANETVAEHFYWLGVPFLYRVHEKPDPADITQLNEFIEAFGYYIKVNNRGETYPQAYQQVVELVKGRPEERAINMTLLRSLKHARYAPEPLGHFGLASKYYSHFTSPIRRYPDLAIHRIIREVLVEGALKKERVADLTKRMDEYAEQSSLRERVAEEAEREAVDLKKVEYMKDEVGQVYDGFISSVTSFGFFVELPNSVEGLVHVSTLNDDYYQYIEKHLMLAGEHTRKIYRIGDPVTVRVVRVNLMERNIDFELLAGKTEKKTRKLTAHRKLKGLTGTKRRRT
jgi:ribonuclease R